MHEILGQIFGIYFGYTIGSGWQSHLHGRRCETVHFSIGHVSRVSQQIAFMTFNSAACFCISTRRIGLDWFIMPCIFTTFRFKTGYVNIIVRGKPGRPGKPGQLRTTVIGGTMANTVLTGPVGWSRQSIIPKRMWLNDQKCSTRREKWRRWWEGLTTEEAVFQIVLQQPSCRIRFWRWW